MIGPRLMDDAEAAAYLRVPKTTLKHIKPGRVFINGRRRWDRVAIDAWLDEQRGVVASSPLPPQSDAEAALERFLEDKGYVSRSA